MSSLRLLMVCFVGLSVSIWMTPRVSAQGTDDETLTLLKKLIADSQAKKASTTSARSDEIERPATVETALDRSVRLGYTVKAPEPPKPIKETRVYDLAELFAIAPNHTARGFVGWDDSPLLGHSGTSLGRSNEGFGGGMGGGMGGMGGGGMGGGGMFSFGSSGNRKGSEVESWHPTPERLMQLIEDIVDAKWGKNGGDETMEWLGSSLLINAYPETHSLVQRLLELLQSRWNARVTFEVQLHWLWLTYGEEERLAQMMQPNELSPVRSLSKGEFLTYYDSLAKKETRPRMLHARIHCHNGQTTAWTSGSQRRTVETWMRERGKLVPQTIVLHRGVACEVCPMLAHASEHATLLFDCRVVESDKPLALAKLTSDESETSGKGEAPRPDVDGVCGQTIATSVRIPIGNATILGSGTSVSQYDEDWQLVVVASVDTVSPRTKK